MKKLCIIILVGCLASCEGNTDSFQLMDSKGNLEVGAFRSVEICQHAKTQIVLKSVYYRQHTDTLNCVVNEHPHGYERLLDTDNIK